MGICIGNWKISLRIGIRDLGLGNGNWDGGWRIEIRDWDWGLEFEIGMGITIENGIQIEYHL